MRVDTSKFDSNVNVFPLTEARAYVTRSSAPGSANVSNKQHKLVFQLQRLQLIQMGTANGLSASLVEKNHYDLNRTPAQATLFTRRFDTRTPALRGC